MPGPTDIDDGLMMSDELTEMQPKLSEDEIAQLESSYVMASIVRRVSDTLIPISGVCTTFMWGDEPEIEIKTTTREAFAFLASKDDQVVLEVELSLGDSVIKVEGPFHVRAMRIQDIDIKSQMSVLSMQLTRVPQDVL